jgi:hypothetical protein
MQYKLSCVQAMNECRQRKTPYTLLQILRHLKNGWNADVSTQQLYQQKNNFILYFNYDTYFKNRNI